MTNIEYYKREIEQAIGKTENTTILDGMLEVFNRERPYGGITLLDWLCEEYKLLGNKEKRYLSNIINPFKNRIVSISKNNWRNEKEYILIEIDDGDDAIVLPNFKIGSMYKGMQVGKEYTLKELGL